MDRMVRYAGEVLALTLSTRAWALSSTISSPLVSLLIEHFKDTSI